MSNMSNNISEKINQAMQSRVLAQSVTGNEQYKESRDIPLWAIVLLVIAVGLTLFSMWSFRGKMLTEEGFITLENYLNQEWEYLYGENINSKKFVGAPVDQIPMIKTKDRNFYSTSFKYYSLEDKLKALEDNLIPLDATSVIYDDREFIYMDNGYFIRKVNIARSFTDKNKILSIILIDEIPKGAKQVATYSHSEGLNYSRD